MPIITLNNVSLAFGTDQILDHADLKIEAGEHIAIAGRNGAGKSTLLRLIAGEAMEDDGAVWRADNLQFATLPQDLPERSNQTVYDAVASVFQEIGELLTSYHHLTLEAEDSSKLADLQAAIDHAGGWNLEHRIEATLDRLSLNADASLNSLSGGWLKRVAIAQSLVLEPDVWILDEPTNHLDLEGIEWLEKLLLDYQGTILFVSHDRQLMQLVATSIVEIDRGRLIRYDCDYKTFIQRRDKAREVEAEHNKQFDDKLKQEETWIRQGIKARRTRNEGRVRALKAMREERARRVTQRDLKLQVDSGERSGKIVKEVTGLSKSLDGTPIVKDLDLIIQRGDRIGILGPNGCGKTTLLKLLLETLKPDIGSVKTGTGLQIAYFDQAREQLNQSQTVFDYIAGGRDFVTINGKDIHAVTYLQNFLFNPDQSRSAIRKLSGGEQNRLLLAKLFSMPANLLVLDEPTNDLDVETLELLEELLIEYDGTVLLVSHDRAFMDNVVSSLLVFEGNGHVQEYVGGYTDWQSGRSHSQAPSPATLASSEEVSGYEARKKEKAAQRKREKDLEKITGKIERIEQDIEALNTKMGDVDFFNLPEQEQQVAYKQSESLNAELEVLMNEWEALESTSD